MVQLYHHSRLTAVGRGCRSQADVLLIDGERAGVIGDPAACQIHLAVAVVIRKRYQRPLFSTKSDRVLYFVSRIVCLGEVLFVLAPIFVLSQGLEHVVILGDAINPWLQTFHVIGWILMGGVVLLIIAAVRFARLPERGLWFRAHAILLAMGGIAFGVLLAIAFLCG